MNKYNFNQPYSTIHSNDSFSEDKLLMNIHQNKLYPPPIGKFSKDLDFDKSLNFSRLKPVSTNVDKILIGEGSFSKVLLYIDTITNKKYAVKKMNKAETCFLTQRADTIFNEINIQGRISHPNIIKLYNCFEYKSNIHLILEYAEFDSLFALSKNYKYFSESTAFYYFIQALNAIYFLHLHSIIHRDLKPENLLIDENNVLKLCDFGWSVFITNNKRTTFCGTVEYMAPEIIKKQKYDESIDIWSLGVLLYELVHSYSPFVSDDLDARKIGYNIVEKDLKFKEGVSEEYKDLIKKLLIKNSDKRIKIEEIYQHPFIIKYISHMYTMIGNYSKIDKKIQKNKKYYKSVIVNDENNYVFDSIPTEPQPKELPYGLKNNLNNKNYNKNKQKFKYITTEKIDLANLKNQDNEIKNISIAKFPLVKKINKAKMNKHERAISLNDMNFLSDLKHNNDISELKITISIHNSPKTKYLYQSKNVKKDINTIVSQCMEEFSKSSIDNMEKTTNFEIQHSKYTQSINDMKYNQIPKTIANDNEIEINKKRLITARKKNIKLNGITNFPSEKTMFVERKLESGITNFSNPAKKKNYVRKIIKKKSENTISQKTHKLRRVNSETHNKFLLTNKLIRKKNIEGKSNEIIEGEGHPKVCLKKIDQANQTSLINIFSNSNDNINNKYSNLSQRYISFMKNTKPFLYKKLNYYHENRPVESTRIKTKQSSTATCKTTAKTKIDNQIETKYTLGNNEANHLPNRKLCNTPTYNYLFVKSNKILKNLAGIDDNRKTGSSSKDSEFKKCRKVKKLFTKSQKICSVSSYSINSNKGEAKK